MFKMPRFLRTPSAAPPMATATTPDQLIAAQVVGLFASEFDRWRLFGTFDDVFVHGSGVTTREKVPTDVFLTNQSRKIELRWKRTEPEYRLDLDDDYWGYSNHVVDDECLVNGVAINKKMSLYIKTQYTKLATQFAEAQRVADAALARQKHENEKWNVVENVFGITRDGFGRIIFKQYEEGPAVCGCGYGIEPTRRVKGHDKCATCARRVGEVM